MNRRQIALGFAGLVSLALVGCGGSDSSESVGQPGDKAKATRVLEIRQVNGRRFEPDSLDVKAAETVTLRVTNAGSQIHEFFLGNTKAQKARDDEMKAMGPEPMKMADMSNSLTIEPGATEELTWTFSEKGSVPFGCHQPGHFGEGMKGTIKVTP